MKTGTIYRERTTCRICGSPELKPVINLGPQHIAGQFIKDVVPEHLRPLYPLELMRCSSPKGCGLVQMRHSISPSVMYVDYGYHSGINQTMRNHLREIAHKAQAMTQLNSGDTVVDIGCNDGTLLLAYDRADIDKLGFDPAESVALLAQGKKLNVITDYFSKDSYERVRPNRPAKIVTSIAMFYDLEDPGQFVRDVNSILSADGVWVIELSYLPFMLEKNSFDTVCHEHLEYYALRQIEWMLERSDLQVHRIEFNDINGGSFRLFIRKRTYGPVPEKDRQIIDSVRQKEKALALDAEETYATFRRGVSRVRDELKNLLVELKTAGKSVYIYGASTKGNTILEYCGIDVALVQKAADRNPIKWGRRTLGTNIPIISEDEARKEKPDYFLVLPWHFFKEFALRESAFLEQGGKFILPLPQVRVVGKKDVDSLQIAPEGHLEFAGS